jgi:hypothetical protein
MGEYSGRRAAESTVHECPWSKTGSGPGGNGAPPRETGAAARHAGRTPSYDLVVRFARQTILAGLFALQLATASNAEPCEPVVFGESHSSLEQAATAALRALYRAGGAYESGGFVIDQGGVFRSSKPVTQRSRSDVSYCIVLPRGATLAGLYHTHVGQTAFSPRDRRNSERVGVPSFIGTIRGGALFVYDPRLDRASAIGERSIRARQAQAPENSSVTWPARLEAALQNTLAFVRRTWNALRT